MRPACPECGADSINHRFVYITVALDETLRPLFAPGPVTRALMEPFYAVERMTTPAFFRGLVASGLAKELTAYDDRTPLLAQMLWDEAKTRGIRVTEVRIFGLPRNLFLARFPNGTTIAYEGIPLPKDAAQVWWLDNKSELKKRFRKLGFPVARGGEAMTEGGALRIFRRLAAPVIVKPYSGSGSRHTTLHVKDESTLVRAHKVATEIAPLAIIEEELTGPVFRATVVGGEFAAALRRDPPHVTGDGTRSVRALVEEENANPKREGPYFHHIKLDDEAHDELAWQGLTFDSIPEKGRRVTLNQKVN